MIHSFTAAGVLPSQYKRMSTFAEMGTVGKQYINKGVYIAMFREKKNVLCIHPVVYRSLGYFDVVTEATEASMGLAVHEIEEIPQYQQSGEVSIRRM